MHTHAAQFAAAWIHAWNTHDLELIMAHYTDDIEITTPMIRMATGAASGTLKGKSAVEDYWRQALERLPDLHFELIEVTSGIDSIALYYKSVMNKMAVEVMFLNEAQQVYKMIAHYN